ncbi:MAG: hypothetical protein IK115_01070 [Lachnospiraceae bacterium]|nr:hypothetical protein [Lachnospiraceae bacterium]
MYLLFLTMKTPNGLLALGILIYTVVLAILCPVFIKKEKYAILRMLSVLPAIAALVHFAVYGTMCFQEFRYLYFEALIPLLYLLPGMTKRAGRIKAFVISAAVFVLCFLYGLNSIDNPMIHNYTRYTYSRSFIKMLDTLEKEYCLGSWKRVDYKALRERYLPLVEEAEKNHDKLAYAAIIKEVCYRFYDSHVSAHLSGQLNNELRDHLAGNDYGLSLIRLDDGSVVAVMVDAGSGLPDLGIHDGTTILSWDGVEIDEAIRNTECVEQTFPVESNEDVYRPIYLAGKGGESVEITYISDDGEVKSADIEKIGSYQDTLTLMLYFLSHDTIGWSLALQRFDDSLWENNVSYMIDDKCGYLRVNKEVYDSLKDDLAAAIGGYYPELTEYYAAVIRDLLDQGMESLVIDIRNNGGGYDCVAGALASLFTEEKRHMVSFGYEDDKGYHIVEDQYIFPDGRYKELPVVVLVNSDCMSAGDGMAKFLGDCPNVTLMGITAGAGVNQNNGGYIYLTDDICVLYPVFLSLSEEGEPLIDTDHTRENRVPLEVTIPMTRENALRMFSLELNMQEMQDVELDYAVKYLEKNGNITVLNDKGDHGGDMQKYLICDGKTIISINCDEDLSTAQMEVIKKSFMQ